MIEAISRVEGIVAPLDRADVDTDAIIPKQFMKSVERTGFGDYLFDSWRYRDPGYPGKRKADRTPDPRFVLNRPGYENARILLARQNFGCGSSREHALWALRDYGFRAIVAPSFAEIFRGNCLKNGLLPVPLPAPTVDALFARAEGRAPLTLSIDLAAQQVTQDDGTSYRFDIDPLAKHNLMAGLDDIDQTLLERAQIEAYEQRRRRQTPWLFPR